MFTQVSFSFFADWEGEIDPGKGIEQPQPKGLCKNLQLHRHVCIHILKNTIFPSTSYHRNDSMIITFALTRMICNSGFINQNHG